MPYLDIKDFKISQITQKIEEDKQEKKDTHYEEIKKQYAVQIESLKKEYEKLIEEERKKAFEEGFKKGREKTEKQLKEVFTQEKEKLIEEIQKSLEAEYLSKLDEIKKLFENLKKEFFQKIDFTEELILSSLEEMFYYLYIQPLNLEYVSKEIRNIISQIKDTSRIYIKVSQNFEDYLKEIDIENVTVEIDENLDKGDFIIELKNVQIESNFKEKMKILKDEIKREIKKHSKI